MFGSSIYPTLCIDTESDFHKDVIKFYNDKRLKDANKALNDFYTGMLHPPVGMDE